MFLALLDWLLLLLHEHPVRAFDDCSTSQRIGQLEVANELVLSIDGGSPV
jgi:hypothetical protein